MSMFLLKQLKIRYADVYQVENMAGLNLGNIPLGEYDADWFKVMSACSDSSLRVKVASVLGYYVRRRKEEYNDIILYLSRKYGLTFSETFNRLLNGDDLGVPVEDFDIDYEVEEKLKGDEE